MADYCDLCQRFVDDITWHCKKFHNVKESKMKFLKGFRTYISLALVAILGAAVSIQQGCLESVGEVNKVCEVVNQPYFGQIIVVMSGIAAWFRKKAN